jgi:hypothetical protein
MFIAPIFTNSQALEIVRCPTSDEWIKKMCYIYTIEYYSAIKNNGMWFKGKWMQLEDILLTKVSQAQKHKGHMISLTCGR